MSTQPLHRLPALAILLVVASCAWVSFDLKLWQHRDRVIEWDVHSYYAYLPAVFIYDDLALEKSDYRFDEDYFLFWPSVADNGGRVIKTTMGLAILYAPFFFLGHGYALLTDFPANGWSEPYKIALLLGGLFYLTMGLDLVRRILARSGFRNATIAITILLLGGATNLFCYASHSASMSHVHSFFLLALFIHVSLKWHEHRSWSNTIFIGLLIGTIALVRPTNALIALFFAVLNVHDLPTLKAKVVLFLKHWQHLLAIGVIAILIWIPQLVYWKTITGEFFFNSYIGERFFFDDPKIMDGLFSFRKGWLIYTPIMLLAVIGIVFLRGPLKEYRTAIGVFLVANIYVMFSWWCWWYGGTFGQRSMIDSYALLSIPMACSIDRIWRSKLPFRIAFMAISAFLIWLNIFQTYQFEEGSLHHDAMTRELYFKQFGKMEKVEGFYDLVDPPDYEKELRRGDP